VVVSISPLSLTCAIPEANQSHRNFVKPRKIVRSMIRKHPRYLPDKFLTTNERFTRTLYQKTKENKEVADDNASGKE